MKKGVKLSAATVLAISALTPAAVFAAEEQSVADGFYVDGEFLPLSEFQQLSKKDKKQFLINNIANNAIVLVQNGKVFDLANAEIQNAPAESVVDLGVDVSVYEQETGNKLDPSKGLVSDDVEAELKVESVSAINAKQVKVTFSKEMDVDTLINSTDKKVKNITLVPTSSAVDKTITSADAIGALSKDGKTLTITLKDGETFEGTYTISVDSNVKGKDGKELKAYAGTFSIIDKEAPEITKVEAVTNTNVATTAKVIFSEPVSAAVIKINGKAYSVDGLKTSELTVAGLALDASKTHTVEVLNATDAKGNVKALQSKTFTVTKDATAPAVTAKAVGDNQILLDFDKNMNVSTIDTNSVKVLEEDLTALTASTDYEVKQVGTSKKQFAVNIKKALYETKTERTLTVVVNENAKDALGNKSALTTQNVKLVKDVVAPVMESVTVVKDNQGNAEKLRIKFSEKLAAAPADLTKVTAKNAVTGETETVADLLKANDGKTPATSTIVLLDDKQTVEIPVLATALGKKVNLTFAKGFVQDKAQTPNDSVAFSKVVEFTKAASGFKIEQSNLTTTTANTIVIDFGRTVVGDFGANAANNPANYTIAGKQLPADTDITIDNNATGVKRAKVTIVLPDEFVAKTDANAVFTVNNVKALDGDILAPFVGYANVKDNVTPKLEKAQWNADGSITLTFSEDIDTANNAAGLEIKLNNGALTVPDSKYELAIGTGADAGKVVVTFTIADDATHGKYIDINADSSYTAGTDILVADIENASIKILSTNNIKDAEGNAAKADITVTATK